MLTLVVRAGTEPLPLIETLTPLVAGIVMGLLGRSYLVCTGGASPEIASVAQDAGADVIAASDWAAGLAEAANRARSASHLIVIDAGVLVDAAFWPSVERFLRLSGARPGIVGATSVKQGVAASLRSSIGGLVAKVDADQVLLVPPALADGDVWRKRYGGKLVLLDSQSQRLTL
ncbi:MAG: hypothetical protein K2P80_11950 [Beijerinckiaceae bacterium]|nr:hypothetical protein [Beijerinckiaceae bacterium]